jgi:hypothetical protein
LADQRNIFNNRVIHPFTEECHEEELKGLEKTRTTALEMAKEEDEAPKESTKDAQVLSLSAPEWEYGVTRHPRGLQLQG